MKEKILHSLRDEQLKIVYYIIALTTACIGFSIYKTQDSLLNLNLLFLCGAVISWGISIFLGFRYILYTLSNLYANFKLLDFKDGNTSDLFLEKINFKGSSDEFMEIVSEGITQAIEKNGNNRSLCGKWQIYLFYLGGFLFIIWHILEIYNRTITPL